MSQKYMSYYNELNELDYVKSINVNITSVLATWNYIHVCDEWLAQCSNIVRELDLTNVITYVFFKIMFHLLGKIFFKYYLYIYRRYCEPRLEEESHTVWLLNVLYLLFICQIVVEGAQTRVKHCLTELY